MREARSILVELGRFDQRNRLGAPYIENQEVLGSEKLADDESGTVRRPTLGGEKSGVPFRQERLGHAASVGRKRTDAAPTPVGKSHPLTIGCPQRILNRRRCREPPKRARRGIEDSDIRSRRVGDLDRNPFAVGRNARRPERPALAHRKLLGAGPVDPDQRGAGQVRRRCVGKHAIA